MKTSLRRSKCSTPGLGNSLSMVIVELCPLSVGLFVAENSPSDLICESMVQGRTSGVSKTLDAMSPDSNDSANSPTSPDGTASDAGEAVGAALGPSVGAAVGSSTGGGVGLAVAPGVGGCVSRRGSFPSPKKRTLST